MDGSALSAYFAAIAAWSVAPGPAMAVVVSRSLGGDMRGALSFAMGLCLGSLLLACAVAAGMGGLAKAEPALFAVAKYVGIAYLLQLAFRMWRDSSAPAAARAQGRHGGLAAFGAGTAVSLGNPAKVLVYLLLVPAVTPLGMADLRQLALVLLVTLAAVGFVFFGASLLAGRCNTLLASPTWCGALHRASAAVIALTSVWMIVN